MSVCPHLSPSPPRAQRGRTLRTLSSDPPPSLPKLPSRASYIPHSVHPRPLLSPLRLPPVHALPTHHHCVAIVASPPPPPFLTPRSLAVHFSRFFLVPVDSQPPSWLHGKAYSSRGSTNSQLRSFTSTWLPTLTSTLESCPPPPLCPRRVQPHLLLVLHRGVVSWDFLSKFITKADKAKPSNVDISLIKDTPIYVNESDRWRELRVDFAYLSPLFISFEMKVWHLSLLL